MNGLASKVLDLNVVTLSSSGETEVEAASDHLPEVTSVAASVTGTEYLKHITSSNPEASPGRGLLISLSGRPRDTSKRSFDIFNDAGLRQVSQRQKAWRDDIFQCLNNIGGELAAVIGQQTDAASWAPKHSIGAFKSVACSQQSENQRQEKLLDFLSLSSSVDAGDVSYTFSDRMESGWGQKGRRGVGGLSSNFAAPPPAGVGKSVSKMCESDRGVATDRGGGKGGELCLQGKMGATCEEEDSDDDCCILDGDPTLKVEKREDTSEEDDIVVTGEKGPVACRDYPHARHSCAQFPFATLPHQEHCPQCHCYVCDQVAPCFMWGDGTRTSDHCHANDKSSQWKLLRKYNRSNPPLLAPRGGAPRGPAGAPPPPPPPSPPPAAGAPSSLHPFFNSFSGGYSDRTSQSSSQGQGQGQRRRPGEAAQGREEQGSRGRAAQPTAAALARPPITGLCDAAPALFARAWANKSSSSNCNSNGNGNGNRGSFNLGLSFSIDNLPASAPSSAPALPEVVWSATHSFSGGGSTPAPSAGPAAGGGQRGGVGAGGGGSGPPAATTTFCGRPNSVSVPPLPPPHVPASTPSGAASALASGGRRPGEAGGTSWMDSVLGGSPEACQVSAPQGSACQPAAAAADGPSTGMGAGVASSQVDFDAAAGGCWGAEERAATGGSGRCDGDARGGGGRKRTNQSCVLDIASGELEDFMARLRQFSQLAAPASTPPPPGTQLEGGTADEDGRERGGREQMLPCSSSPHHPMPPSSALRSLAHYSSPANFSPAPTGNGGSGGGYSTPYGDSFHANISHAPPSAPAPVPPEEPPPYVPPPPPSPPPAVEETTGGHATDSTQQMYSWLSSLGDARSGFPPHSAPPGVTFEWSGFNPQETAQDLSSLPPADGASGGGGESGAGGGVGGQLGQLLGLSSSADAPPGDYSHGCYDAQPPPPGVQSEAHTHGHSPPSMQQQQQQGGGAEEAGCGQLYMQQLQQQQQLGGVFSDVNNSSNNNNSSYANGTGKSSSYGHASGAMPPGFHQGQQGGNGSFFGQSHSMGLNLSLGLDQGQGLGQVQQQTKVQYVPPEQQQHHHRHHQHHHHHAGQPPPFFAPPQFMYHPQAHPGGHNQGQVHDAYAPQQQQQQYPQSWAHVPHADGGQWAGGMQPQLDYSTPAGGNHPHPHSHPGQVTVQVNQQVNFHQYMLPPNTALQGGENVAPGPAAGGQTGSTTRWWDVGGSGGGGGGGDAAGGATAGGAGSLAAPLVVNGWLTGGMAPDAAGQLGQVAAMAGGPGPYGAATSDSIFWASAPGFAI
eukprot:jgi/Mesen1/2391/ME000157S01527